MGDLNQFGRFLVLGGVLLLVVGLIFVLLGRFLPGGRLPGDIVVTRDPVSCFIPLATSLLLSLLLTLLLNLWSRR
jgi:Zn-dependent protease with chaperone function